MSSETIKSRKRRNGCESVEQILLKWKNYNNATLGLEDSGIKRKRKVPSKGSKKGCMIGKGGPENSGCVYRGVRQRTWGKWVAEIREPSPTNRDEPTRRLWLGTYSSALDAALAYDQAAKIMYASNAILNFPQHNANALDCSPQQETKHVKQGTDQFESNQDEFWLFDNINTQIPLNQNEGGTIDMNKPSNDLKLDEFEYLEDFLMTDNFDLEPYGNSGGFGQDGDCNSVYDTAYLQNGRSYDLRCGVDNLDGLQYNVEPLMMQDESKLKHDSRFMCNDNSPSN